MLKNEQEYADLDWYYLGHPPDERLPLLTIPPSVKTDLTRRSCGLGRNSVW